jgi:hypothetical protein
MVIMGIFEFGFSICDDSVSSGNIGTRLWMDFQMSCGSRQIENQKSKIENKKAPRLWKSRGLGCLFCFRRTPG